MQKSSIFVCILNHFGFAKLTLSAFSLVYRFGHLLGARRTHVYLSQRDCSLVDTGCRLDARVRLLLLPIETELNSIPVFQLDGQYPSLFSLSSLSHLFLDMKSFRFFVELYGVYGLALQSLLLVPSLEKLETFSECGLLLR